MLKSLPLALVLGVASSAWAQSVISAHSGVIQYVEGQVTMGGKTVQPKFAEFPEVKAGQTLAAEDGRAEILLTPGVFLRLAENSSFRMVSNKLADTRLEILSGSAMIQIAELLQDNAITVVAGGMEMALVKKGLYRVDADPGRLRVYEGEARVTPGSGDALVARKGREVLFGAVLQAHNFDAKQTDAFYRWSARRDEYVAQANISAAKSTAGRQGMGYSGAGSGMGMWAWNPWFGMFTYLPYNGVYYSPFGSGFYSPRTIYNFYSGYSDYYYNGGGRTSTGTSYAATTPRYESGRGYTVTPRASMANPVPAFSGAGNSGISRGIGGGGGARGSEHGTGGAVGAPAAGSAGPGARGGVSSAGSRGQ